MKFRALITAEDDPTAILGKKEFMRRDVHAMARRILQDDGIQWGRVWGGGNGKLTCQCMRRPRGERRHACCQESQPDALKCGFARETVPRGKDRRVREKGEIDGDNPGFYCLCSRNFATALARDAHAATAADGQKHGTAAGELMRLAGAFVILDKRTGKISTSSFRIPNRNIGVDHSTVAEAETVVYGLREIVFGRALTNLREGVLPDEKEGGDLRRFGDRRNVEKRTAQMGKPPTATAQDIGSRGGEQSDTEVSVDPKAVPTGEPPTTASRDKDRRGSEQNGIGASVERETVLKVDPPTAPALHEVSGPESVSGSDTGSTAVAGTGAGSGSGSVSGAGTGAVSVAVTGASSGSEPAPVAGTGESSDPKLVSGAGTGSAAVAGMGVDSGPESVSMAGTGAGIGSRSFSGAGTGAVSEVGTGAGSGSESVSGAGTGEVSMAGGGAGSGYGSASMAGTGASSGSEPAPLAGTG